MKSDELIDFFTVLGARNPEQWARSEAEEGIPQRARYLFLRQAWKLVVGENDDSWIAEAEAQSRLRPDQPNAIIGPALERLMASGVSKNDLTTVVRVKQWELLVRLCYLLDDPGDVEPMARDIAWRLFQVDDEDQPTAVIGGLHESVLETDPSGHAMQPK